MSPIFAYSFVFILPASCFRRSNADCSVMVRGRKWKTRCVTNAFRQKRAKAEIGVRSCAAYCWFPSVFWHKVQLLALAVRMCVCSWTVCLFVFTAAFLEKSTGTKQERFFPIILTDWLIPDWYLIPLKVNSQRNVWFQLEHQNTVCFKSQQRDHLTWMENGNGGICGSVSCPRRGDQLTGCCLLRRVLLWILWFGP